MLNALRRRARKVGLGIHKQRGEDNYMIYDLNSKIVVGGNYYCTYPLSFENVESVIEEYENLNQ